MRRIASVSRESSDLSRSFSDRRSSLSAKPDPRIAFRFVTSSLPCCRLAHAPREPRFVLLHRNAYCSPRVAAAQAQHGNGSRWGAYCWRSTLASDLSPLVPRYSTPSRCRGRGCAPGKVRRAAWRRPSGQEHGWPGQDQVGASKTGATFGPAESPHALARPGWAARKNHMSSGALERCYSR